MQFDGKDVPGSPFVMGVLPKSDLKKVVISGDTSKKEVPASLESKFNIDTRNAGVGDILVTIKVFFNLICLHFAFKIM